MTRRKRKITKKQTGGMIVNLKNLPQGTFLPSVPTHGKDCVPRAMEELGLIPSSVFFARCYENGVSFQEIVALLNAAYPIDSRGFRTNHRAQQYFLDDIVSLERDLTYDLTHRLEDGDALLAIHDTHMFIVFKRGLRIYVREPQLNSIIPLGKYLEGLISAGIDTFYMIFTERGSRIPPGQPPQITEELVQRIGQAHVEQKISKLYKPPPPAPGSSWHIAQESTKPSRDAEARLLSDAKMELLRQWNSERLSQAAEAERLRQVEAEQLRQWKGKRMGSTLNLESNAARRLKAEFLGHFSDEEEEEEGKPTAQRTRHEGGTRKKTKKKQRRSSGVSRKRRG